MLQASNHNVVAIIIVQVITTGNWLFSSIQKEVFPNFDKFEIVSILTPSDCNAFTYVSNLPQC